MGARSRSGRRVERTEEWEQLKMLFGWPDKARYEAEYSSKSGKLRRVGRPTLFESYFPTRQGAPV